MVKGFLKDLLHILYRYTVWLEESYHNLRFKYIKYMPKCVHLKYNGMLYVSDNNNNVNKKEVVENIIFSKPAGRCHKNNNNI
ncbi:Uncharacterized protein FWK35_00020354 [Aphis craccivora]|uniref:Uncharacterized protein n=1 Tax=Aphis craccivora TaxID=307492 RepID=A0A6G0YQZ7_APHCR|nr:Uncharacterized protein FWK35_00020354 [Aphis craccivora]